MKKMTSVSELQSLAEKIKVSRDHSRPCITICGGTGCRANGGMELAEMLSNELDNRNMDVKVQIKLSGCHGLCQKGPVVVIDPQGIFYQEVGLKNLERDVDDIIEMTLKKGEIIKRLLYKDPSTKERIANYYEIPFYSRQMRIALKNNGKIDPCVIEDYLEVDGYLGLAKVLEMDPLIAIEQVKASGLRGRGGGGFSTGLKWTFCRNAVDQTMRYIICNADEGDPGAFMDRSIMEGDPHSVLEGMAIGAYAMSKGICPTMGYIYIRAEYPLAIENLKIAIEQAEALGVIGDNIMGTDFSFHVKIKEGAGAFVCGEETALMASIEGERGMPRPRPPFPANKGLFGKPSNINNVETWANIPKIINDGPDWYADIGTEKSTGTKVFSLVGKVVNCGLVEVPMGISLREVIFDIGGGIPNNRQFKAAQTGGPSGGCIPAQFLDLKIDYDNLAQMGSIMGSGGLVVMDEDNCMVDIARYFLTFTQAESCGKCTPCRLGTKAMLEILERITEGNGKPDDIELLEELALAIKAGSLCGLGQTAPNPVLTTLKYFREEYEEHIFEKKCRAGACRALIKFDIDPETCKGCRLCVSACPTGAISGEKKQPHVIDQEGCVQCGSCRQVCKFGAIIVSPRTEPDNQEQPKAAQS